MLVEGNYLLMYDEKPWDQLKALFDERWFVSCDEAVLRERVIVRNSGKRNQDIQMSHSKVPKLI